MAALGVGEILAITSLTIQVIGSVKEVMSIFQKAQNAPEELSQLYRSLERLLRHFEQIKEAESRTRGLVLMNREDADEIDDILTLCKALFDGYDRARSGNSVLRAIWGTRNSDKVKHYQAKIDRYFQQVLFPFWLKIRYGLPRTFKPLLAC